MVKYLVLSLEDALDNNVKVSGSFDSVVKAITTVKHQASKLNWSNVGNDEQLFEIDIVNERNEYLACVTISGLCAMRLALLNENDKDNYLYGINQALLDCDYSILDEEKYDPSMFIPQ